MAKIPDAMHEASQGPDELKKEVVFETTARNGIIIVNLGHVILLLKPWMTQFDNGLLLQKDTVPNQYLQNNSIARGRPILPACIYFNPNMQK